MKSTRVTQGKKRTSDEVPFYLKTDPFTSNELDDKLEFHEQRRQNQLDPMSRYHRAQYEIISEYSIIGSNNNNNNMKDNPKKPNQGIRMERSSYESDSSNSSDEGFASEGQRRKRKRRKHEKKRSKDKKPERRSTPSISVQELRQKRIDRERQEKKRQLQLIEKK